jgi:hypothetical protein
VGRNQKARDSTKITLVSQSGNHHRQSGLALALFMPGIGTNHPNRTVPADNLAISAHLFY